ncbi:MAG: rRNA maturation RNase YbeY [Chloroflexota bacterium]
MCPVDIEVDEPFAVDETQLRKAIKTVLRQHESDPRTGVAVRVTDNVTVQQLNRDFRGVDGPTDVLSFPAELPPMPDAAELADDAFYLGDLAIAYPYAAAQAQRLSHDLTHSFGLLVVHGTLHLLGYDHDTPENKAVMWAAQANALTALGIPLVIVPALEESDHE